MNIPLSAPNISELEIEYVTRVLRSNQLSLGPVLREFEEKFAGYIGTKYAIAANSGTSALHMCVRGMELGAGAEVLTTSFSFVASVNCLLYENVFPRLIDIDPLTFNLDVNLLREFLRTRCTRNCHGQVIDNDTGLVVKGILPVQVFGMPATMDEILEIAAEYDLAVLEDACEAIGAEHKGRRVGTFGDAAVFAFYPNKQMTTGEGGMVVTNDSRLAEHCRSLRNQGRDVDGRWLKHVMLGYNYRLNDVQAALGLGQLERIEELLHSRAAVAKRYFSLLDGVDSIELPHQDAEAKRSWFVFVIQVLASDGKSRRDALREHLNGCGIASQTYFPAIHRQPYFQNLGLGQNLQLPETEYASDTCLALPFSPHISEQELQFVANIIKDGLQEESVTVRTLNGLQLQRESL